MHPTDRLRIDTPEQVVLELPIAGIGSRFLAIVVDTLLQAALYVAAFGIAGTPTVRDSSVLGTVPAVDHAVSGSTGDGSLSRYRPSQPDCSIRSVASSASSPSTPWDASWST